MDFDDSRQCLSAAPDAGLENHSSDPSRADGEDALLMSVGPGLGATPATMPSEAQMPGALRGAAADSEHSWRDALSTVGNWVNEHPRLMGGVKALGGLGETLAGGAAILAPEPTMLSKVVGGAAVAHGLDTVQAGVRQALSGRKTQTLTSHGIEAAALAAGADAKEAERDGELGDAALGLGLSMGAGALNSTGNAAKVAAAQEKAAGAAASGSTLGKAQSWWLRGAENDQAWLASSTSDKFYYEIGQKTLTAENWEKFGHIVDPIERGRAIWNAQGCGALMSEGRGLVLGAGKTLSTGPTPGARLFAEKGGAALGAANGAVSAAAAETSGGGERK